MTAPRKEVLAEGIEVWLGDCRDVLPMIGRVDAIVTDPPYGLEYNNCEWDASIPDWFELASSVSEKIVFTTAPTTLWSYPRPDWVANWYRPASSSRTAQGGFNHWSPIAVYGPIKFPVDCINLHAIANSYPSGFGHPSPKPVELMRWLVTNVGEIGDVVLDPFMGSGTTGVAAVNLGRKFIGIEREQAYFDLARERISEALRRPDMFVATPAPLPKQEALI